jgi:hypothetical protein
MCVKQNALACYPVSSFKRPPATSAKEKPREEVHAPPQLVHLTRELPGDSPKYDSPQGAPAVPYGSPKSAVPCSKWPLPTSVVRMTQEVLNTPLHLVSDRQEPAVSSLKPEVVTGMFTHAPSIKASPSRHVTHEMTLVVIHEARDVRAQSPSIKTHSTQLVPAETVPLASLSHTEAGPGPIPSTSAWKSSMSDCMPTLSTRAIPKQPIDALGIRLQEPLLSTSKET